jgi:hypothetical protein
VHDGTDACLLGGGEDAGASDGVGLPGHVGVPFGGEEPGEVHEHVHACKVGRHYVCDHPRRIGAGWVVVVGIG